MIRANDPCPCGSGKKYKKCCGAKDSAGSQPPAATARSPGRTAPTPPPARSSPKRRDLELLAGVLNREAGLLQQHPHILASHLHNRLHSDAGTRSLLTKARRPLAGRPWAELRNRMGGVRQATLRVLHGAGGALAFSPDGSRLATAGSDSLVRLWDAETGRCVDELPFELNGTASVVEWSADRRWLAVAGTGGVWITELAGRRSRSYVDRSGVLAWVRIRIGASETGQATRTFERGPVLPEVLAWSPDGSWLADGDSTGTVRIWSLTDAQAAAAEIQLGIITPLRLHAYRITGLAWAPRESLLAAAARDGTVSFFSPNPWDEIARVKLPNALLGPLAWSPDGKDLVVARGNVVDLVDVRSSLRRGSIEGLSDWTRTRGYGETTAAPAPAVVGTFEGHTSFVTALAWSPDGSTFASAGADNTVRLWSADAMKRGAGSPAPPEGGSAGDGRSWRELLAEDPDQAAELLLAEVPTLPDVSTRGIPSPDGSTVAVGKEDGEVRIRSVGPDATQRVIREGWTEAKAQAYAEGLRSLSAGFIDFTPSIGGYRLRINDPDYSPVRALAWSPDGKQLAAASLKLGLEIHNLETGELRRMDTGHGLQAIEQLAWSPDGLLLASAEGARNQIMDRRFLVRLWNPVDGTVRTVFEGEGRWSALAWAPDGSLLGFAAEDGSVRVFSPADNRTLLLARSLSPIQLLRFSAGTLYLTAVDDGAGTGGNLQAYVWKLCNFEPRHLSAELERIEARFGRRAVHGGSTAPQRENPPETGGVVVSTRPAAPNLPLPVEPEVDARQQRAENLLVEASGLFESSPAQALALFEKQESLWRELGNRAGLACCLGGRAAALMATDRDEAALDPLRETVAIWRELREAQRLKAALGDTGSAFRRLGRHDEALAAYAEEETLCRELGDRPGLARSLAEQAMVRGARKEWGAALARLQEEETLRDQPADRKALVHCLGFQAWIQAGQNQNREAVAVLARQERELRELDEPDALAEGLLRQVELLVAVGEPNLARAHAEESAAIFASLDRTADEAKARALVLKTSFGKPTLLKGVGVLLAMLAPAAIGIGLGMWSPWLWLLGAPLVLVSVFLLAASLSPRLRRAIERVAVKVSKG